MSDTLDKQISTQIGLYVQLRTSVSVENYAIRDQRGGAHESENYSKEQLSSYDQRDKKQLHYICSHYKVNFKKGLHFLLFGVFFEPIQNVYLASLCFYLFARHPLLFIIAPFSPHIGSLSKHFFFFGIVSVYLFLYRAKFLFIQSKKKKKKNSPSHVSLICTSFSNRQNQYPSVQEPIRTPLPY